MSPTREAAGVAVFSPDGRLLLGRHAHDGRWATIGGAMEPGEAPRDAAVREEVGLHLESLDSLGRFAGSPIYDVRYPNGDVVRYAVTMFTTVLDRQPFAQADRDEILDVAWVSREDVAKLDIAPDMAEIVPASFAWMDAR